MVTQTNRLTNRDSLTRFSPHRIRLTHLIANVGEPRVLVTHPPSFLRTPPEIPEKGSGRVPAVTFHKNCSVASDCTCRCTVRLVRQCVCCAAIQTDLKEKLVGQQAKSSHKPAQTSYIFLPPPSSLQEVAPDIDLPHQTISAHHHLPTFFISFTSFHHTLRYQPFSSIVPPA